jgi:predicted nucleotide-binding protein
MSESGQSLKSNGVGGTDLVEFDPKELVEAFLQVAEPGACIVAPGGYETRWCKGSDKPLLTSVGPHAPEGEKFPLAERAGNDEGYTVEAASAVYSAIESLIAAGKRAYSHSVPIEAENILFRSASGRMSRTDASAQVKAAIVGLSKEGKIEAYVEPRMDWLIREPMKKSTMVVTGSVPIRRQLVIQAAEVLQSLGHAGFDKLLLEFGLPDLEAEAGHEVGGLLARSIALARYALHRPEVTTAEGIPIGESIVLRAIQRANQTGPHNSDTLEGRFLEAITGESSEMAGMSSQETATVPAEIQNRPLARRDVDRRVFIVHGHDDAPREAVARFLERAGFEAVILHERPNKGRTIITKFREESVGIGFAAVLMTPDDLGKVKEAADLSPRARQNVVFELGFFIGALGPERVAALVTGDIERPSDFNGVVYINFDAAGAWKQKLGVELEAAGFEIEWKKAMV